MGSVGLTRPAKGDKNYRFCNPFGTTKFDRTEFESDWFDQFNMKIKHKQPWCLKCRDITEIIPK